MNIAFFLLPKSKVAHIYNDCTLRQGLEKMKYHGYSAIPVITRDNKYAGTVSEGDFLWYLLSKTKELDCKKLISTEEKLIGEIMKKNKNPSVGINSSVEDLVEHIVNRNFVPVVDDLDNFIGIVTRSEIIRYYYSNTEECVGHSLMRSR